MLKLIADSPNTRWRRAGNNPLSEYLNVKGSTQVLIMFDLKHKLFYHQRR